MMRLVVDWIVEQGGSRSIPCAEGVDWYSEALLPSAFLPRRRGDKLAESYTHADAVIGHFDIGDRGKEDLELQQGAKQLTVLEGKIFSRLSSGVQNAGFFDQAARNVACMAEVLSRAKVAPSDLTNLAFHVLAPMSQIESGVFGDLVTKESVRTKVKRRVAQYEGQRDEWFAQWFAPTLEHVRVGLISWEGLIGDIVAANEEYGGEVGEFYAECLRLGA